MENDKTKRARDIFLELSTLDAAALHDEIDRLVGNDRDLKDAVIALLDARAAADAQGFMDSPTASMTSAGNAAESTGAHVGPYRLLQLIGEGGFGSVFLAEQHAPVRRRVALKIIKLGMDTKQVIARFEAERQALALMDHPHIARVFDAGATESGRPYFAMEYVVGDAVTKFADAYKLDIPARLVLFEQTCSAVQHAHTKGIIHRDLKPANVLVSMVDGKPFAKVIDFGIAKATASPLTSRTLFTEHRQLIGTPEYMSPEQADGSPDIDTRTDVYALGVLLYELLTGATPFDAARLRSAAWGEMQRIIREEEPPAPSLRLNRDLGDLASTAAARGIEPTRLSTAMRGELDWVVMKALEKERARRYDTPAQFADDVGRHLRGEPVLAAPPSRLYRAKKFVRRNKGPVIAVAAVTSTLLLGIGATAWAWNKAQAANAILNDNLSLARETLLDAISDTVELDPIERATIMREEGLSEQEARREQAAAYADGVRAVIGSPAPHGWASDDAVSRSDISLLAWQARRTAHDLKDVNRKMEAQVTIARAAIGDIVAVLGGEEGDLTHIPGVPASIQGIIQEQPGRSAASDESTDQDIDRLALVAPRLAESLVEERDALAEQTRKATHDSNISQSLLDQQHGVLAASFDHARAAYEIDPTWTAGMQLDLLAEQSTEQWKLYAHIPEIGTVDALAIVPEKTLVTARLGTLRVFDLETARQSGEIAIRPGTRRILPFLARNDLVLLVQERSLQMVDITGLRVVATWETDMPIDAAAVGRNRIAITTRDSYARILSTDLVELGSLAWPAEATRREGYRLRSIAITLDDTKVVFSSMGLSDDRVLWEPDSDRRTILSRLSMNQYAFDADGSLIGVANELYTTGYAVTWYNLQDDLSFAKDRVLADLPKENLGRGSLASVTGNEIVYIGERGVARVDQNATRDVRARVRVARFDSLLLDSDLDPRTPCASADGRYLAFSDGNGVVVFARTMHWGFDYVEGAQPVYTHNALFEIQSNGRIAKVLNISDPAHPGVVFARLRLDDPEPGRHTTILGYGVSPDGRTHAVRVVDMPNISRYASPPINHRILVYRDIMPGADDPAEPIRIAEQDRDVRSALTQGRDGLLEFSADGSLLLSRTGSNAKTDTAFLYHTADGTPVPNWPEGPPTGNDITMVRGHDRFLDVPDDDLSCRVRDLRTGRVLRTFDVPSRVHAVACGNFAGRIAIKTLDDKVFVFDATTGDPITEVQTRLVPAAWSPNDDVFVATDFPTSAKTEQNLVLARARDAAILGVLQRGRGRSSSVMISPDGTGVLHPQVGVSGRLKDYRVSESLTPDEAQNRVRQSALHDMLWSPIDRSAIQADSESKLRENLGAVVELEGTVVRVVPTRSGGHFTLYLDDEYAGVLVFIREQFSEQVQAQIDHTRLGDLLGRRVRVIGPLREYGGYSEHLQGRLQITWDASSTIAIAEPVDD